MSRESLDDKAVRFLTTGRVKLVRLEGSAVDAVVTGDGAQYVVTHRPGGWRCSCVATVVRCSHVAAVALVTLVPEETL